MAMMIKSSRIYTHRGVVDGGMVVEYGKVKKIYQKDLLPTTFDGETVDYGNNRVIPGIIDVHTHGFMGWAADTVDPQDTVKNAMALATVGVTGFLSTNGKWEHTLETNAMVADLMETDYPGARILGLHMEGPFINPDRRGGFTDAGMTKPDLDLAKAYYESARGALKYMTLAPELPGNLEIIDYLVEKGVKVGAAHSNATYAQTMEAIERGLSISIHTGNAMGPMHQREVTVMGALLLDDRVDCELIPDFYHVCPEMIQVYLKMKGKERIHLVSDSGSISGVPAGKYQAEGRYIYVEKDGLVHLEDGTISGSSKYVLFGIQNLVEKLRLPLEDVVVMSGLNPARVLGISHKKGSLLEKKDADFVVIDDDYDVIATYVEGNMAYDRENPVQLLNPRYEERLVEAY
ncbi:N-acetylglucosamine-6-phosphate deacetylase [Eubacteriales bacterium OttesenSCG-928-M02]|nr:N-acetylglucosamine-6-phosphate deacetylase [Eubacteriales bacterium OttesenSCG-928-M02]